jgi:hypothetical protein
VKRKENTVGKLNELKPIRCFVKLILCDLIGPENARFFKYNFTQVKWEFVFVFAHSILMFSEHYIPNTEF